MYMFSKAFPPKYTWIKILWNYDFVSSNDKPSYAIVQSKMDTEVISGTTSVQVKMSDAWPHCTHVARIRNTLTVRDAGLKLWKTDYETYLQNHQHQNIHRHLKNAVGWIQLFNLRQLSLLKRFVFFYNWMYTDAVHFHIRMKYIHIWTIILSTALIRTVCHSLCVRIETS